MKKTDFIDMALDNGVPPEEIESLMAERRQTIGKFDDDEDDVKKPAGPTKDEAGEFALKHMFPATTEMMQKKPVPTPTGVAKHLAGLVAAPIGDFWGYGERMLGASVGRGQEGMDPVQRFTDPDASILKPEQQKVLNSGAHGLVKFGALAAMGAVTDPVGSAMGGGGGAKAAGKVAAANKLAKSGAADAVELTAETAARGALGEGRVGAAKPIISGVPLTKGQQAALGGVPKDLDMDKVARVEKDIQENHPKIWEEFAKGQSAALQEKAGAIRDKGSLSEMGPEKLEQNFVSRVLEVAAERGDELGKRYDEIEKAVNPIPLMENELLQSAFHSMDKHGFYNTTLQEGADAGKLISVPQFKKKKLVEGVHTVQGAEIVKESKKLPDQHIGYDVTTTEMAPKSGKVYGAKVNTDDTPMDDAMEIRSNTERRTATIPGQTIETESLKPKKYHYSDVHEVAVRAQREQKWTNGVSERVADGVTEARKLVHDNMTYSGLKEARTKIRYIKEDLFKNPVGTGPNDHDVLDDIYKKLSLAMETQLKKVGKEAEWKELDGLYSKKNDFRRLEKILSKKSPDAAINDLVNSVKIDNLNSLRSVKSLEAEGALPNGTFANLQNAVFNRLIETASPKGVIDGDLLLKQVKDMPAGSYNELFGGALADDMAQLVMDAVVTKMAQRSKAYTSNPNALMQGAKDLAGNAGMIALITKGKGAWAAVKVGQFIGRYAAQQSPKAASDYLRSVDRKSLTAAFFKGAWKAPVAASAARAGADILGQESPQPGQTQASE